MSEIIRSYNGGREAAAARLGLKLKKFDNHAYENAGCSPLSDTQVFMLEQDCGTNHFPNYIASMYGDCSCRWLILKRWTTSNFTHALFKFLPSEVALIKQSPPLLKTDRLVTKKPNSSWTRITST